MMLYLTYNKGYEMKKMLINVDAKVHEAFKKKCNESRRTMSSVIEEFMGNLTAIEPIARKENKYKLDEDRVLLLQEIMKSGKRLTTMKMIKKAKKVGIGEISTRRLLKLYNGSRWTSKVYRHEEGGRPTMIWKLFKESK